jgi:small subunit ribosomal protein S6
VRSYELVFIVHPEVDGDDLTTLIETVRGLIERSGGQVTQVDPWGLRRLAYPIRNLWEGQYVLMRLRLEPQSVAELERSLKLTEQIMRHLIVHLEEEVEEEEKQEEKQEGIEPPESVDA